MAQGKQVTITVKSNSKTVAPVTTVVEPIVIGGVLAQDPKDEFPGVDTKNLKN